MKDNSKFLPYIELVESVDKWSNGIKNHYCEHIICKSGCSICCHNDFSIFIIEAYHIIQFLLPDYKNTFLQPKSAGRNVSPGPRTRPSTSPAKIIEIG